MTAYPIFHPQVRLIIKATYACVFLGFLLTGCVQRSGGEQEREIPKRIEILFLGHDSEHHNSEKYMPMLAIPLFQKGINLTYTDDPKDLTPENLEKYDGLMIYANHDSITAAQEDAIRDFVEGGKGLIPIHCASYMFRNSEWYVKAVGGQFKSHDSGTFVAGIIEPGHPVMKGLTEFETWDETYVHHKLNPDITVLMERVEGDHHEPWTWVRAQGEGRVFYTAYGHDERTWKNPGFHQLIANGVLWAVGDKAKELLEKLKIPEPVFETANIPNYEKKDPPPRLQHPLTPEQSQKLIKVPVDFELRLFAAEPDIVNPVAMAWDEKGRLYVIETENYPNEIIREDGQGNDRIKICEDTDGDGRADKFTVFADGLNIPTSMVFADGGLIVSMAPSFLFLKDTDGDDKADVRKEILTGWGKSDTHAQASNLKYGPDNKIWGVVGYSGFSGEVAGKKMSFGQGVYRFDPDGSNLEYLGRTTNNTWGLGFSEEFDVFISTANGLHSAYFAMPNKYVKRAITGGSGNTVHRIDSHYEMPHLTPYLRQVDYHGGYTAAAGHNLYTARSFPEAYWNRIALVNEPTGRVVHKAVLEPAGAGYIEENGFNLLASSDEWFAPVHSEVGPDGAVWVADWYNFIIQHNPTPRGFENGEGNAYVNPWRDSRHGRIYRVVYKGAEPYTPIQLSRNDTEGLLAGLKNKNMFWRTTAQRIIVETQNREVIPALYEMINDRHVDEIGLNSPAVHALWTLHGLGALDGSNAEAMEVVARALSHPAAGVRQNAVKVLPDSRESLEAIIAAGLINDPDLKTRLAAVLALADMPPSPEIGALLYRASQDTENAHDKYLSQALFAAVTAHQASFLAATPGNLVSAKPDSALNLTERIVRSLHQEQYKLDRWSPVLFPPDAAGKEITVQVTIGRDDDPDAPFQGVILAQGNNVNGYVLFLQEGALHWVVVQEGKAYKAISHATLPDGRAKVLASLSRGGAMRIEVDGQVVAHGQAPSLFTVPLAPGEVRVGWDYDDKNKVGDYPGDFDFRGELRRDGLLELKKPVSGPGPVSEATALPSTSKGVVVNLSVVTHEMKYDKETFTVKAGQKVTIYFTNPDFMQHNLLIIKPGTLKKVGAAADALARDPNSAAQEYVPQIPEVIIATELVDPEDSETLVFTAPDKPGDYPFVCSVPGHWSLMNGIMKVR